MWRFILLAVVAVSADDRWSRRSTDRKQGDWIPVAAPCVTCHKGRSVDQDTSATGGLPSVLTPPAQHHPGLLPPPPPDGLFHAASSGFLNGFPGQQTFTDNKARQFFPSYNTNSRPQHQSSFRFPKTNSPQIPDSSGIPSNLFQVSPQQFTNPSLSDSNAQYFPAAQFIPPPPPPPPQTSPLQPYVTLNQPQLLQQSFQYPDFSLSANQPLFLSRPGDIITPEQQNIISPVQTSIGKIPTTLTTNVTSDSKQPSQDQGNDEVQLLYVPVETLRQRGNFGSSKGPAKKVPSNHVNNNFSEMKQQTTSNTPSHLTKEYYRPQNTENEFYRQQQDLRQQFQNSIQNHQVIQETTAPQVQYKQTVFPQQVLTEQTTFAQNFADQFSDVVTPLSTSNKEENNNYSIRPQNDSPQLNNQQSAFNQYSTKGHAQDFRTDSTKLGVNSNQQFYEMQQLPNRNVLGLNDQRYQQSYNSQQQQQTLPPPHQPPLSVYMETDANNKIIDVLTHLKSAKTIPVLDTIGADSPQVFVGPSNLNPPSGYLKFELPYLSSLDNNRVERKVDRLPFFVAPLNFQPPPGYSKIPFPAPHIGSVVVSNITVLKTALHEKPEEYENKPEVSTPHSTSRYTIPSDLSPISSHLPSLVNSLQEEKYFPSSTPEILTAPIRSTTTPVYTTPYRRNPIRGSSRGYTTTTSEAPTRRTVTRQRRPFSGRPQTNINQQENYPTTEQIATTVNPQYEQNEQPQNIYSEFQTTEGPHRFNPNLKEAVYDTANQNVGNFDGRTVQPEYDSHPFYLNQQEQSLQRPQNQKENVNNILHSPQISSQQGVIPELEQVQQYFTQLQQQYFQGNQQQKPFPDQYQRPQQNEDEQLYVPGRNTVAQEETTRQNLEVTNEHFDGISSISNNNFNQNNGFVSDAPLQQTTEPVVPPNVYSQNSETTSTVDNSNSNKPTTTRRDPLRQRVRGRTSYQTTTEYVPTESARTRPPAHRGRRPLSRNQQQLQNNLQPITENVNVASNYPSYTERVDEQPLTERNNHAFQYINNKDVNVNLPTQSHIDVQTQTQAAVSVQNLENDNRYHTQQQQVINDDVKVYGAQQQHQLDDEEPPKRQFNQNLHNVFNSEENVQVKNNEFENSTPFTQTVSHHISTVDDHKYSQHQPVFADQTPKFEDSEQDFTDKPINQQRLTKYTTRLRGRLPNQDHQKRVEYDDHQQPEQKGHTSSDEQEVQQHHYQQQPSLDTGSENFGNTESIPEPSTTTTAKPVVVRVRGRVRNRQRTSGVRQTTTTEVPNYPAGSVLDAEPDSHVRKSPPHRTNYAERSRHSNRFRNSNFQSNNNNADSESFNSASSTIPSHQSGGDDISSGTTENIPPSRKYNHILNRNTARRTNTSRQTHSSDTSSFLSSGNGDSGSKYLVRTTRRPTTPITRLTDGRGRIRRPMKTTPLPASTTEYPPLLPSNENFAPSAASNEVLDPYYPPQTHFNNDRQRRPPSKHLSTAGTIPYQRPAAVATPTPFTPAAASNEEDDYWNRGVTIQQSNSYDFTADSSPVTRSTMLNSARYDSDEEKEETYNTRTSSSWRDRDQTPFSSNEEEEYIAYTGRDNYKNKSKLAISGKDNQYNEKEEKEQINYENEQNDHEQLNYRQTSPADATTDDETEEKNQYSWSSLSSDVENKKQYDDKVNNPENLDETQPQVFYSAEDVRRNKDTIAGSSQNKPVDPITGKKPARRRGAWVRVRVNKKPKDMFETAESQNLASLTNDNAIKSDDKSSGQQTKKERTIPANHRPTDPYDFDSSSTESDVNIVKDVLSNTGASDNNSSDSDAETTIPQNTTVVNENTFVTTTPASTIGTTTPLVDFQKQLTDMIREIIKEEEAAEETEEEEKAKDYENKTEYNEPLPVTTNLPSINEPEVAQVTTSQENDVGSVTVLPEIHTTQPTRHGFSTESIEEATTSILNIDNKTNIDETEERKIGNNSNDEIIPKNQQSKVLGTSTTTEISLETEICYRGRCVKSKKNRKPLKQTEFFESDLMPVE